MNRGTVLKMGACVLALSVCGVMGLAKNSQSTVDYSGQWALDFSQTKNPPAGLQEYNMMVKQDGQQMKVETAVQGELKSAPDARSQGSGYPGGGYPGGRRGGMGGGMGRIGFPMPGGGMGIPGGGYPGGGYPGGGGYPSGGGRGGRSRPDMRAEGNPAAYKLYPHSITYKLDGSESAAQFGDETQTDATAKAEWAKDGALKLLLVGSEDSNQKAAKIQVKDQWKLSDDRQTLTVERSVKSPQGSGSVRLIFHRQSAEDNKAAEFRSNP